MTTDRRRRNVLVAIVVALAVLTASILLNVLGTILFAITVAYVLVPVHRWLVRRGLSETVAGLTATLVGFVGAIAVFSPIVATLYFRRDGLVSLIRQLPDSVDVTVFETTITVEATDVQSWAIAAVRSVGADVATAAPELAVKFALFVVLLFGLIVRGDAAARAAVAPVPREYRDVVRALGDRASETLYAIYVLQLATAAMTLVVAYPFFWMLGYDGAFILALLAAILQFVPIIGPSFLVAPIALYHLAVGDVAAAALVGVLGGLVIGWLPDITVRPKLSQSAAGLPGSLYFVGFTGGLFTLGAIGIVVGPLIVAVFVEAVDLLAAEVNVEEPFSTDGSADSSAVLDSSETADGTASEATPFDERDADSSPPTTDDSRSP